MKDIIWLSPSLAAAATAARLVAFFQRRAQMSPCRGVELTAPSRPAGFQTRTRVLRLRVRAASRVGGRTLLVLVTPLMPVWARLCAMFGQSHDDDYILSL